MNKFRDLQINPYEYWKRGINFIIIVFSCHYNGIIFSIALLNCLLIYLIWNDSYHFILFYVIYGANSFRRIHNVKQDYTLNSSNE